ncbi:MAG TPA: hypothetical protein VHQ23_16235, partial [Ilumatobacteraceae bacterium]|nr:hypothetical protein [Ilumatobacteraceae bacterium]
MPTAIGMRIVGSTGTDVDGGGNVEDVGALALGVVAGEVATVGAGAAVEVTATVSETATVAAGVGAEEPEALEQEAINAGTASHSNRALARVMIADSTVSAADALV